MTDIGKAINLDLNQPQFNKVSCKNGNLLAHQLQPLLGEEKRTRGNSLETLFVFANLMSCSGYDLTFSRYLLLEGPSFILFLWPFQLLRLLLHLSIIIAMHVSSVNGNFSLYLVPKGSLSKHDFDGSENVIWKRNFAFLPSLFNYSNSLSLKNVF